MKKLFLNLILFLIFIALIIAIGIAGLFIYQEFFQENTEPIMYRVDKIFLEEPDEEKNIVNESTNVTIANGISSNLVSNNQDKNIIQNEISGFFYTQLNNLANKILPEIYTNLDSDEIISMIPQIATYSVSNSIGWPYEVKGATINKVWYGVPVTLDSNVKKLHEEIYSKQTDYKVSSKVKEISNQIIKKSGYSK